MVPTFNVPHLAMIEPIIRALVDYDAFAFVGRAPAEWVEQKRGGLRETFAAFSEFAQRDYVRLHLNHVVAGDDDSWGATLSEALQAGYHSVMIDASALPYDKNVRLTGEAMEIAHGAGIACQAELGAVDPGAAGETHLTDPEAAGRFVAETSR